MVHFSSKRSIIAMVIYSILTFGAGPYIVRFLIKVHLKIQGDCVPGFLLGFTVSIFFVVQIWFSISQSIIIYHNHIVVHHLF